MKNGTAALMGYKRDGLNKGDATFQERLVGEGVRVLRHRFISAKPPEPQWPDKRKMIALV